MTPTTASAQPTCSARVGTFSGEWSEQPLWCSTTVGLTSYVDNYGRTRRYCRHHMGVVLYRHPAAAEAVEPCFFCGRLDPILQGIYSRVTLGTGVVNLCDHCRSKGDEQDEEPEREYDLNPEGDPTLNGAFG